MENTHNLLVNRQLEVVRKNLVTVFRFAVKALIDKACFCSVDDGCEEFVNFSAAMEQVLHHRLRPSKMWHLGDNKNHFWFYIKSACHRHDLRSCINNIDNIENIRSPVGKGRAFLRCALMEKRLAEYLGEALKQTNVTRRFYQDGAIMLGEEASELCGVLVGLNSIDFGFCLKGENYDSVPVPLAVSYSPFMKFKQSPESLYSDMEEMRELSCESSLASEDGQEGHDGTGDTWQDRYNMLHKRYMGVLEQKSFLEELTASQEKALQAAAAAQQEQQCLQQEAKQQQRQYEAVVLELQAQVARMKAVNESLQRQLMLARHSRSPMSELEFRGESQTDASNFAAALAYRQESEQNSLTSSLDRAAAARPVDTRSLTSAMSEFSTEAVPGISGIQMEGVVRRAEDTQSMVPLTGSLSDLHSTAQDISSISSIPAETASANVNAYAAGETASGRSNSTASTYSSPIHTEGASEESTGKHREEVNGNNVSPVKSHSTDASGLDLAVSQAGSEVKERDMDGKEEDESEGTDGRGQEEGAGEGERDRREMASVWHDGLQESIVILRGPSSNYSQEESFDVDTDSAMVGTPSEVKDFVDDSEMTEDQDVSASAQNEMASSGEGIDGFKSEAQQPDVVAQNEITGDRVGMASGSDREESKGDVEDMPSGSEREETKGDREETASDREDTKGDKEDVASGNDREEAKGDREDIASGSDKGAGSEPEILSQGSAGEGSAGDSEKGEVSEPEVLSQGSADEGSAGSSNKGEASEPEILSQESAGVAEGNAVSSDKEEISEPEILSQDSAEGAEGDADSRNKGVTPEQNVTQVQETAGDRDGTGSGSDSSGSDVTKDAWDMLSDANHESS